MQAWVKGGLLLGLVAGLFGCGPSEQEKKAEAEKKAFEAAAAALVEPVGLISAYQPHLVIPDLSAKYVPKQQAHLDRAMTAAANEVRHAANAASQTVERAGGEGTKDLVAALKAVAVACAEAQDPEALKKCVGAVTALDAALVKAEAARAAANAPGKIPHLAPEAITDGAKKGIAGFLKTKGPSALEQTYFQKRADTAASVTDVINACQAAQQEMDDVARQFERAEEGIRLIAVTHKMALEAQCNKLSGVDTLQKELAEHKKKPKSEELKLACGKAKAIVDDGVPAAAFVPLEKEYVQACEKK